MSGLLLDTYVVAQVLNDPSQLSAAQHVAIASATGNIYASAASAVELARHERDGKVRFSENVADLAAQLTAVGITEEFARSLHVQVPHKDPIDRTLVATGAARGLTPLTNDRRIR